jgi:hypothetical protein
MSTTGGQRASRHARTSAPVTQPPSEVCGIGPPQPVMAPSSSLGTAGLSTTHGQNSVGCSSISQNQ